MTDTPHIETHDTTKPDISTAEVRQAVPQGVAYVLGASLILVILAFTAIYVW